jgi:hypothetical protein
MIWPIFWARSPMLTPEEMARIEEDERKRHAEEQYRAEVRAKLGQPAQPPSKPYGAHAVKISAGVVAVVLAVTIVSYLASRATRAAASETTSSSVSPKSVRWATKKDTIASGQITVRHGGYVYYKITIKPDMRDAVVDGNFSASGGSGNDIMGIVADEENYTNWINGHEAKAFWSTQGKETTGEFELRLAPGIYYLALSNKFSALTDKDVFLEASLSYQQPQVY